MVKLWRQWCRLCAREDNNNTHINVFIKDEVMPPLSDVIKKCFSVNIKHDDNCPQVICSRCHQLATTIKAFAQRVSKVQAMFVELHDSVEDLDAGQVKLQYELHEDVESDVKLFGNSTAEQIFENKPNMTEEMNEQMIDLKELGYVNEEILNSAEIKTENVKEDNLDIGKYEWTNQQTTLPVGTESCKEESKQKKRGIPRKKEVFTCIHCQKAFHQYLKYRHHMQVKHGMTLDPLQYPCTKCDKIFTTGRLLQQHGKINHPLHQKLIPCSLCDKRFMKVNVAQAHIRAVHLGEKPFVCEECGKSYKTPDSLREHKRTHSDEMPFKCTWCEKRFKTISGLVTHEDTHNETNYICTICGLKLNTRRTLNMHMVTHSDQKRHKCDYCGNEYKRAKALKNHLILHTGLKPYKCDFCQLTFAQGANCRSHKKKVHPVELAEMEAAGTKSVTTNIPKLEQLRSATSNKNLQEAEFSIATR